MGKAFSANWGKIILSGILLFIIILNFKPGYFILGNDNYSPELNPKLSLMRSLTHPAWRDYRILGVPSDSEQADVFRSFIFYVLNFVLPGWLISQLYVFFSFFMGSFSIAYLLYDLNNHYEKNKREIIFLFSGIFYLTNLLTAWIFFSPLKIFMAGYAFMPFVLWRMNRLYIKINITNVIWFIISILFFTTSSMVATTFIVETAIILFFLVFLYFHHKKNGNLKHVQSAAILSFIIFFTSQLFWVLPFIQFVKTNSKAVQDSYINRVLTPELVENEIKYNTLLNVPRFYASWMDTRNNDGTYQYIYRFWYDAAVGQTLSYVPLIFFALGSIFLIRKKKYEYIVFLVLFLSGWFMIKGINPPMGGIYAFMQNRLPFFKQIFRWQSSKLFPALIIPLSLLAPFGIILVIETFEHYLKNLNRHIRKLVLVPILILLSFYLLSFVFPFFTGGLIDKSNFVKIPSEYFELSNFLEKNYKTDRIYIAPEANTLYFRSYSFGFFGSSFLNYLIPNPIVEKALTTGSYENEQAQNILEESYYSENPDNFADSLALYKTPLVLLDKNARPLHNGYVYNLLPAEKVIEENSRLKKIWSRGKLSLYQLTDNNRNQDNSSEEVYQGHNWSVLNLLKSALPRKKNYYSSDKGNGLIYPLALSYDAIDSNNQTIIASTIYKGKNENYSYKFQELDKYKTPSKINYNPAENTISVSPLYPVIGVNNKFYYPKVPSNKYQLSDQTRFITAGQEVIDLQSKNIFQTEASFDTISNNLEQWKNLPDIIYFDDGFRDKYNLPIPKRSIINISLSLSSTSDSSVNICAFSRLQYKCLNRENTLSLTRLPKNLNIILPEPLEADDTLEIYIDTKDQKVIRIQDFRIYLYSLSDSIKTIDTGNFIPETATLIPIHTGDKMQIAIPKIKGYNTYQMEISSPLIPSVSRGDCQDSNNFLKKIKSTLEFSSLECFEQALIKMERITPEKLGMIYYKGQNTSGIPLILSIRDKKSDRKSWENRLEQDMAGKLDFFMLPQENRSYFLELYSFGLGPRESRNSINDLTFQFIPAVWSQLKLIPAKSRETPLFSNAYTGRANTFLYGINNGFSSGWMLDDSTPVRINGWEQGFIINSKPEVKPEFSPNNLAFAGYLLGIGGILIWIVLSVIKYFNHK